MISTQDYGSLIAITDKVTQNTFYGRYENTATNWRDCKPSETAQQIIREQPRSVSTFKVIEADTGIKHRQYKLSSRRTESLTLTDSKLCLLFNSYTNGVHKGKLQLTWVKEPVYYRKWDGAAVERTRVYLRTPLT